MRRIRTVRTCLRGVDDGGRHTDGEFFLCMYGVGRW